MASASPSSSAAAGATASPAASPFPFPAVPPRSLPHSSRRFPPPCWSYEDTLALIDAYGDKWHSLGRGNLRASHWDDVAAAVARECPSSSAVPKTSVQCRHKIEKLRKRYRSEKQRSLFSWLYFRKMDAMERGAAAAEEAGLRFTIPKAVRSKLVGFRPSPRAAIKPVLEEMRRRVEEKRMKMRRNDDGIRDVASALGIFGEEFFRMEQMKVDVSREMEKMRMEMELKRTEMILDCQRQIVETMVHRFMGK
ncbi:trihelix transcription factor ASIL1 [Phalaenopsis equestris]|uniref:trihelix transcription factor ASIL1 n=1 Tax=Phalaenopsis equestris TaxID=78828 RepID=UPI0009E60636|nr:trihelix transcription factor ASIL1 [Phalaenopsis equestris]